MSNFIDGSYGSAQSTELIAKVLAGRCEMRYTRATVGKGRIPDDRTPTTMTESAEYVMDAKISGVSNPVKGECQVTVQIKSDDVQEDFRATNVVLFAEDPDVGEIPYAYLCLENEPEWIGAASSSVGKLITFEIIVFVGGVDNVSISINSESIATIAEVEKLIKIHNLDVSAHDEKFKKHIAMTTDQELINSLINNTAKAGSLLLFSYIGHKNGNVTGESYNLYTGLNNCNLYSGCVIRVKLPHESVQQEIHPNYFQHPSFYLAKIDESNAKQVTIYPLGGNTVEIIDNLTSDDVDKALSAAQGKWLNENKLGKREKAADSDKLDGHFSNYFATAAAVQTAQRAANQGINAAATAQTAATQGINAAAAAHGRANEAYSRAEQAFTSASNGKIKIANAITGKGIPTSTTASWQELAGNIGKIGTFKKIHMGQYDFGQSDDWAYQYVLGYGAYLNVFEMREPIINAYVVLNITTQHYMYSNHPNVERKFYVFFGETRDEFKAQVEYDNNSGLITAIHGNYDTINTYDGVLNGHKITYGIFSKHKKFSIPMKYMAIAIHNTNNFVVENFIKKCALLTL